MKAPPDFTELARFLEKDLSQSRAAEIEEGLSSSEALRADLERVRRLLADVAEPDPDLARVDLLPTLHAAIAAGQTPRRLPWWRWGLGGSLAAALLVAAVAFLADGRRGEFRAKGTLNDDASKWAGVQAYVVAPGGSTSPLAGTLKGNERLAFAYRNGGPTPFSYLVIFAVDGSGQVFWYYPAWEHAAENPSSVAIHGGTNSVELPDAVRQELAPGRVELHALFTRAPVGVTQVEAALQAKRPIGALAGSDSYDEQFSIVVVP